MYICMCMQCATNANEFRSSHKTFCGWLVANLLLSFISSLVDRSRLCCGNYIWNFCVSFRLFITELKYCYSFNLMLVWFLSNVALKWCSAITDYLLLLLVIACGVYCGFCRFTALAFEINFCCYCLNLGCIFYVASAIGSHSLKILFLFCF